MLSLPPARVLAVFFLLVGFGSAAMSLLYGFNVLYLIAAGFAFILVGIAGKFSSES